MCRALLCELPVCFQLSRDNLWLIKLGATVNVIHLEAIVAHSPPEGWKDIAVKSVFRYEDEFKIKKGKKIVKAYVKMSRKRRGVLSKRAALRKRDCVFFMVNFIHTHLLMCVTTFKLKLLMIMVHWKAALNWWAKSQWWWTERFSSITLHFHCIVW